MLLTATIISAQVRKLDEFETKDGWSFIKSDGVNVDLSVDKGLKGNALRFNYDFTKGTGYGGIQKLFPIDLPDNYEFTFYIKAESPANNFEIKFIDSTGNNVWWVNNRNFDFPGEWKKITIKKRHISFAWGPTTDQSFHRIDRIEFTISSYVGGKGTIWIDDLKFEPLPPELQSYPVPEITASSSAKNHSPDLIIDNSEETYWQSVGAKDQSIYIDFTLRREFGGLQINWLKDKYAESFNVLLSEDGKNWEKAYSVQSNQSNTSFIRLPEAETSYLKINLTKSRPEEDFGISELKFLDIKSSLTPNDFLIYTAKNSPVGDYPRYFSEQASYWTITGVNGDVKEALINEDGMVEVDKGLFSIEPMSRIGDSLYNWSNVKSVQSLGPAHGENEFIFKPTVTWQYVDLRLVTSVTSKGEANSDSRLFISYSIENLSNTSKDIEFYLLIRPFQVNPYYQWLNLTGGVGKINSIHAEGNTIHVDDKVVMLHGQLDSFGAAGFDEGNMVDLIRKGIIPPGKSAVDSMGMANGVVKYSLKLGPGEKTVLFAVVPFYENRIVMYKMGSGGVSEEFDKSIECWKTKVDHIKFNLPESAGRIVNTYKSNLVNGKVPCVVDSRGPDPVPENDSHGEMIYLIREYFNFTHDTLFLRSKNQHVLKAVEYIESLIAGQTIDHFKNRRDGKIDWVNYTPYENRLIGSFIMLDQPERAHELIAYFLHDQRPQGWNQWAEVVWKDYRKPGYIGDMPHTWVGSDFINAIRAMFVYENEYDQSLVLASALYQDWIDAPGGMSKDQYHFSIFGDLKLPANGIKIKNFNGSKLPAKVTVNGNKINEFNEKEITVHGFPAEVLIDY